MRTFLLAAAVIMSAGSAQAGCVTGAIVGGVVGHVAGGHGLLGAGAGCVIGHEHSKNEQEKQQQAQQQQQPPSGEQKAGQPQGANGASTP